MNVRYRGPSTSLVLRERRTSCAQDDKGKKAPTPLRMTGEHRTCSAHDDSVTEQPAALRMTRVRERPKPGQDYKLPLANDVYVGVNFDYGTTDDNLSGIILVVIMRTALIHIGSAAILFGLSRR